MPTYILLGNFTDQGIRNVKETTKRAEAVRALAKKAKVTVKDMYWTMGRYDVVAILDAPDEATVAALGLSIGASGNVRMQTLRAFTEAEIGPILGKVG
ncbi:MAG TPA: GYD domain-containing protein [Gemmataceae bacterium]|nr:GYD domain-containing protein [Gemmataceae bacterium]